MVEQESSSGPDKLRRATQLLGLRSKAIARLFRESASEWSADNAPRLGAAIAFYTLLSLAPTLIVIIGVAAFVFGDQAASGQLAWEIQDLVGNDAAQAIQAMIQGSHRPAAGLVAASLSVITLLFGASSLVVELRDDLNTIWHCPAVIEVSGFSGIIRLVKDRFYSFVLVLGAGFALLVLLTLSIWISALGRFFGPRLPIPEFALHVATFVLSFIVVTFLFGAIYKTLPDVELKWSDVGVGASVTAVMYALGKQLIGLYLGKASFASTYGAAGSLVVLLVWVYYSAQLFFLGAEFTKVYAGTFGSHVASVAASTPTARNS